MMGAGTARYRYPLQVLLRKHEWDVEAIGAELATAKRALLEHEESLRRLRRTLDEINQSLSNMRSPGASIDLARERMLLDYRAVQDEAFAAETLQLANARQSCEQIAEQLTRARRSVKGLERHSEALEQVHVREAASAAAKESDDAWLLGQRWRDANP